MKLSIGISNDEHGLPRGSSAKMNMSGMMIKKIRLYTDYCQRQASRMNPVCEGYCLSDDK